MTNPKTTLAEMMVGDVHTSDHPITDAMIRAFAEATGDTNPLHLEEDFAAATMFGRRIAHGMLTAGILSGVTKSGETAFALQAAGTMTRITTLETGPGQRPQSRISAADSGQRSRPPSRVRIPVSDDAAARSDDLVCCTGLLWRFAPQLGDFQGNGESPRLSGRPGVNFK